MSDRTDNRTMYDDRPPVRRQRRKKTPWQKFKEAYLPLLILLVGLIAVIALIVFVVRLAGGSGEPDTTLPPSSGESQPAGATDPAADPSAQDLLERATALAAQYDYAGAIALLNTFAGEDAQISAAIEEYTQAQSALVQWEDSSEVPHISFQPLIVDTGRAFDGDSMQDYYNRNNLTVDEFRAVLDQLYGNGYVLISMTDMAAPDESGVYQPGQIMLPAGKTPLVMSLIPAHYSVSQAGDGFARRLVVGSDGKIACEYIDATSTRVTGAYDFVTILEEFLAQHPDFSYHGARAILGISGSDEPLGYDLSDPQEAESIQPVVQCLLDTGYQFASFTYDEIRYGDATDEEVTADVQQWEDTYSAVLGEVNILIYAGGSELVEYEGAKYDALYAAGFRYFCGMNNNVISDGQITDNYVRQARRTINGTRITEDADLVEDLFDANTVVSSDRP